MKSSGCEYQYGSKRKKRSVPSCKGLRGAMPPVMLALLALVSAVMLMLSLFVRVQLTEINDKNVAYRKEAEELLEENRRLRIEYEFAQDLDKLESDAKSRLGMQSPLQRRPEKIDTPTEDKVIITDNG